MLEGDGRLKKTDGEEECGVKREDAGKLHWERNPGEYWREEKGGPEPSFDGKISKLNVKGQSLLILYLLFWDWTTTTQ